MSTDEKKDQKNEKKDRAAEQKNENVELTENQTEKVSGGRTKDDGVGGSKYLPTGV